MVVKARVTAAFRRLVALLARAFYAGECPPKTAEEEAAAAKPSRTKQQGTTHGLGILLLDALCGTDKQGKPVEWINEDALAEHMNLHNKQVRKALRFLEQEQLLAREHRAESARSRKKQAAAEAAASGTTITGEAVAEEVVEGHKAEVISWCCIDWPSVINVTLLRLWKLRHALQDQATDTHTIQKYICSRCQRNYTSLDVASFPMQNWEFLCEHCHEEGAAVPMQISYQGHDGSLLDAKERDQRVATAKRLQRGFEEQVKPLIDQLDKLKGIPVPDFGPLDDWAANRSAEQQHKARRAAGGGGGHSQRREGELDGIDQDFEETQVEINFAGQDGAGQGPSEMVAGKALPPWLLRQGISPTTALPGGPALLQQPSGQGQADASMDASGSEAILSPDEDQKRVEEEYLRQYMAQVAAIQQRQAAARAGTLTSQGQQELKELKHDLASAEAEVDAAEPGKRVKTEGDWTGAMADAAIPGVKLEEPGQQHVLGSMQPEAQSAVQDVDDWEDVQVKQTPDELAGGIGPDVQPVGDADEWEDV